MPTLSSTLQGAQKLEEREDLMEVKDPRVLRNVLMGQGGDIDIFQ
jgi:hypothetical protein